MQFRTAGKNVQMATGLTGNPSAHHLRDWNRAAQPRYLQQGRLVVFARGVDNTISYRTQIAPNGPWHAWIPVRTEPSLASGPAAAINAPGDFVVFARNAQNVILHCWQFFDPRPPVGHTLASLGSDLRGDVALAEAHIERVRNASVIMVKTPNGWEEDSRQVTLDLSLQDGDGVVGPIHLEPDEVTSAFDGRRAQAYWTGTSQPPQVSTENYRVLAQFEITWFRD